MLAFVASVVICGCMVGVSASDARPGQPAAAPQRYRVTMAPWLQIGQVGWCAALTVGPSRAAAPSGTSCAFAASGGRHLVGWGTASSAAAPDGYSFAVVDDRVARVVLPGGALLTPRPSDALPNGWKTVVLPPSSGAPSVKLRAASGNALASTARDYVWPQPSVSSDGATPPGSPCGIRVAGPAADPRASAVLPIIEPTFDLNGRGFLPCAQTTFRIDGQWLAATVLVDATTPGTLPDGLAGAKPLAAHPGILELTAASPSGSPALGSSAFARRDGDAWLVVSGSAQSRSARAHLLTLISAQIGVL